MKRFIPFARVSTKAQDTERQLRDLQTEATKRNWPLLAPITETISGTKKNDIRAGIQAVLAVAQPGDTVLTTEISRIGRNVAQVMTFLEELAERGVSVYVLNHNLNTLRPDGTRDPMAWAMLAVGVTFAALERSTQNERINSGIAHKRATTDWQPGRPKGYVKDDGKMLADPKYAKAIKRLKGGTSVRDVVKMEGISIGTAQKLRNILKAQKQLV